MKYGLEGRYKIAVVNARTKKVRWQQGDWHRNLIQNTGMDRIAADVICACFTHAIAGIGTTPGSASSAVYGTTATCDTGGNVVLVSGTMVLSTSPTDVGNIIKWISTGFEGRITSVGSTTTAIVTPAPATAQSGSFVLYRTNFGILEDEVKRSATYVSGSPNCTSSLEGNELVHQRTWDFSVETASVTYTEVGVGWSATVDAANTVFARFLLHSPVSVNADEQLRLFYQLRVAISPSTSTAKTTDVTGWPITVANQQGDESVQLLGLSSVNSSGATVYFDTGRYANEPAYTALAKIFLSSNSTALAALGSCVDRKTAAASYVEKAVSSPTYVQYSYLQVKQVDLAVTDGNASNWRSCGIGYDEAGKFNTSCVVWDLAQTKLNYHELNLRYFFTWSRTLTLASV